MANGFSAGMPAAVVAGPECGRWGYAADITDGMLTLVIASGGIVVARLADCAPITFNVNK